MFSRAIRFLLVIASAAVVAFVALSEGGFTSLISDSLKEKITSIVGSEEAIEAIEVEEVEVEEVEEVEETIEAEMPEEVVVEEIDSLRNATIEREE